MHIKEAGFSFRAENVLLHNEICTVETLEEMTDIELLKLKDFGRKSLRNVRNKLTDLRKASDPDKNTLCFHLNENENNKNFVVGINWCCNFMLNAIFKGLIAISDESISIHTNSTKEHGIPFHHCPYCGTKAEVVRN